MSRFWDWALEAYARPGVAEACLELQDAHGQNVPLVLWVAWSTRSGRRPDLVPGALAARRWEGIVVTRLREVRRGLKPLSDADAGTAAFRDRIKALELEAERLLMTELEALDAVSRSEHREEELLAEASRLYGAPAPESAFRTLLARL